MDSSRYEMNDDTTVISTDDPSQMITSQNEETAVHDSNFSRTKTRALHIGMYVSQSRDFSSARRQVGRAKYFIVMSLQNFEGDK